MLTAMGRRGFLLRAATAIAGTAVGGSLSACGEDAPGESRPKATSDRRPAAVPGGSVLLAYSSRPGENYWNGDRRNLRVGNTERLAGMIADRLECDVHRIEAADPYSGDYDETVARNVREQNADARPEIANTLSSIDGYDTLLLATPIWNVRAPMIMSTFAESYDFVGKTVLPVTTHAMSGLGTTAEDYVQVCRGARISTGLAVRGEEVQSAGARAVAAWLQRTGGAVPPSMRRGRRAQRQNGRGA
jgi:flavodoxin